MAKQTTRKKRIASKQKRSVPAAKALQPQPEKPEAVVLHPLPSAWRITKASLLLLKRHWKFFSLFCVLFGVLNIALVRDFSTDVNSLKSTVGESLGTTSTPATSIATYVVLVSQTANPNDSGAAVYQLLLIVMGSLAIIWALRQMMGENVAPIRLRDAFYKGMYPLVPFLLVIAVLFLELLPFIIGGSLYGLVVSNGIVVTPLEHAAWLCMVLILLGLSLWLVTKSLFAVYIVTLADMTPIAALRGANKLVKGHKLNIIRKMLFLAAVLTLASSVVVVTTIIVASVITQAVIFILSILLLPIIHSYFYHAYRELLP